MVFQHRGQRTSPPPLFSQYLEPGTLRTLYLSVYVLFILLECSPSSPLVSFLNFSRFRTQLKWPLLDDIMSVFPCCLYTKVLVLC